MYCCMQDTCCQRGGSGLMNAGSRSWTRAMLNEWPSSMGKIQTIKKAGSMPGSLDCF